MSNGETEVEYPILVSETPMSRVEKDLGNTKKDGEAISFEYDYHQFLPAGITITVNSPDAPNAKDCLALINRQIKTDARNEAARREGSGPPKRIDAPKAVERAMGPPLNFSRWQAEVAVFGKLISPEGQADWLAKGSPSLS